MEQRVKNKWVVTAAQFAALCVAAWIVGKGIGWFFGNLFPRTIYLDATRATVIETFYTSDRAGYNRYYVSYEANFNHGTEYGILKVCDKCYIECGQHPQFTLSKVQVKGLLVNEIRYQNDHKHYVIHD